MLLTEQKSIYNVISLHKANEKNGSRLAVPNFLARHSANLIGLIRLHRLSSDLPSGVLSAALRVAVSWFNLPPSLPHSRASSSPGAHVTSSAKTLSSPLPASRHFELLLELFSRGVKGLTRPHVVDTQSGRKVKRCTFSRKYQTGGSAWGRETWSVGNVLSPKSRC